MSKNSRILSLSQTTARDLYPRLCNARDFIDTRYHLPLDLQEISRQAFLSPFHFLRLFQKAFNKTPHQYVIEKRIERAKQLLANSELSVTEICFEVGFQSLGSFSSLFHRCVGAPPSRYRRRSLARSRIAVLFPEAPIPACFLMMFGTPSPLA